MRPVLIKHNGLIKIDITSHARNVNILENALKKMDLHCDHCHDALAYGELHNYKLEPLDCICRQ